MNDKIQHAIIRVQKNNDLTAADEIVRAYYDEIYLYLYSHLKDKEDAKDCAQEVFLKMYLLIKQYDSKKGKFIAWLIQIAHNQMIDEIRKKKRKETLPLLDENQFCIESDPILEIYQKDKINKIKTYIDSLPDSLQQIYTLKCINDFTFKECAEKLYCSENTCKTRYYTLIKKIQEEFKDE